MQKSGFVISVLFLLASCTFSSNNYRTKNDTADVAYRPKGSHTLNWQGAMLSFSIAKSNDTFNYKEYRIVDTMRGLDKKPVYDSTTRSYKMNFMWVEVPDSVIAKMQIVYLPK